MSFFDKIKSLIQSAVKVGDAVGTTVYRKSKKPLRRYMAPERAEKFLEEQEKVPHRAPMNVPNIKFDKEKVIETESAVEERLAKSEKLIKNIEKLKIVSHEPNVIKQDSVSKKPKPHLRTSHESISSEIPRGLISLSDVIESLHNHNLEPNEWTPKEIAQRFRLRESDTEDLLKYFKLVYPEEATNQ